MTPLGQVYFKAHLVKPTEIMFCTVMSPVRDIDIKYQLSIYLHFLKNIDIAIDIDMVIFEDIDIDKAILKKKRYQNRYR